MRYVVVEQFARLSVFRSWQYAAEIADPAIGAAIGSGLGRGAIEQVAEGDAIATELLAIEHRAMARHQSREALVVERVQRLAPTVRTSGIEKRHRQRDQIASDQRARYFVIDPDIAIGGGLRGQVNLKITTGEFAVTSCRR